MPWPPPSSAGRIAAHWVVDTLAADEDIDFSVIKALVGVSPQHLVGAPDAARERVAFRCLNELATFALDGGAPPPTPSKILRVDAVRTCEDLLVELTGQVGSSGILDKDIILPFIQDIQNFIRIKKPTLPESSLELLRKVDPEIQSMAEAEPSSVEQNGIKKHGNHQSLCNVHHLNSNIDTPRPPIASTELQLGNLTLINNLEKGNFKQCPIESTVDLDKPLETDRRFYNQPWEYGINVASVGTRALEKDPSNVDSNISGSSTSCNATLQGNIVEPSSKKRMVDETTVVEAQPCKRKSPEPIATEYTTMVQQLHSSKAHLNHLQHDSGQKVNQDPDGTASVQPVEKYSIHEESTLGATSVIPSVSCNGAMQEDKSKTCYPSGNTTQHCAIFEEQNCDKSQLKVSCADKNKHALPDDAAMLGKNKVVCGGLNVQGAPGSHSCNLTLHDNISEAHCFSDQNIGKSTNDTQKHSCNISVSISCQDGYRKTAKQDSNKQTIGNTVAETSHAHYLDDRIRGSAAAYLLSMSGKIPLCSQDQIANDSLRVSPEKDLCKKCGKGGQLLQCSSCLLSAHDSCFGSSFTLAGPGQLYCPVCNCAKATEDYKRAKKKYVEAKQLLKQHEQQSRLLPRAVYREGQLNGHNTSSKKQTSVSETIVDDLAHQGEESNWQRKKQKTNVTSDACNEAVIEKASSVGNSDVAPMNASVLQNKSNQLQDAEQDCAENTEDEVVIEKASSVGNSDVAPNASVLQNKSNQLQDAEQDDVENTEDEVVIEKASSVGNSDVAPMNASMLQNKSNQHQDAEQDHVENTEAREGSSSQNRCSPAANPEIETNKEDGPTHSHHQSKDSASDCGKPSSPPWRTTKHHRARLQESKAKVSSNSTKAFGQKDRQEPLPSRKRKYAYAKRCSNPAAPTRRRTKLYWTIKEEAALREAMKKFAPRDNGYIPWAQILEYGGDKFHETRQPSDLRVKWRNMKNSGDA